MFYAKDSTIKHILSPPLSLSPPLPLSLSRSLHHCSIPAVEGSWCVVVLWGLMSSQFFFGFGHHATVTSLRFDAGFVGLRGEMSGLTLLSAGLLVGLNMLGSQVCE